MPFTSLKLEKSKEYHQKLDKFESKQANNRDLLFITAGIIFFLVLTAGVIYNGTFFKALTKVLMAIILALILALIGFVFSWLGTKFEAFGEWLVNRTKR